MNRYLKRFILLLAAFSITEAFSQKTETILSRFKDFQNNSLQEKVYVHMDRDFYLTGEIMWFKVYCVDGSFHLPLNVSKVAYLEILNSDNRSLVNTKVELGESGGDGSLFIPATLASGTYRVRAYTQWMRNFSPEFYFQKDITVVNPFVRPETTLATAPVKTQVEFFPEGGQLVNGLAGVVGFKIVNATPDITHKGVVVSSDNDTVATVASHKFGLGRFSLTPAVGKTYALILEDDQSKVTRFDMPAAKDAGFVMHLMDSLPGKVQIEVNIRGVQSPYTYLFVHSRHRVVHAEAKPYSSGPIRFEIDRSKLPDGIVHFTLLNEDLKPVAERLYFARHALPLQIDVTSENKSYSSRRKVRLDVTTSVDGKPASADLSVAVYQIDSLTSPARNQIAAYLSLSSDLRGHIESPEYYLSDSPEVRRALDNLMLTHGWRKFDWEKVMTQQRTFAFVPEYRSHLVTGKVVKSDGTPAAGIYTFLASPGKQINLYTSLSNSKGDIYFEVHNFNGSRKMILQPVHKADSMYQLQINNPYSTDYSQNAFKPIVIKPAMRNSLKARSLSMQVQDIYYRELNDRSLRVAYDTLPFYGRGDQNFDLDDYTRFPVLEEVMREYVPGVLVRKRRDGFHFLVVDNINKGILPEDPLILLDGVLVRDLNKLMQFDPLLIRRLEVVMRNFFVGSLRIPGIVSYKTYTGDMAGYEIDSRGVVLDYEGLQFQREYYNPKYEKEAQRNNRMPDQRTLLYWQSDVKSKNGNAVIEFYTSDVTGNFQVVVEGMNDQGNVGTGLSMFTVRPADF